MMRRSAYKLFSLIIDRGLGISKRDNQVKAIRMVTSKKYDVALNELDAATKLLNRRTKLVKGVSK